TADRDGALPLSFAQQRLWFLDSFAPASTEYNTLLALRLHGRLDVPALRVALREVIARHESLRTTFVQLEGRGAQVVHEPAEPPVTLIDLTGTADRETLLRQHVREELNTAFDLRRGPLLRATLVRLGAGEHVLALVVHHIVTDGWSMGILATELGEYYRAALAGEKAVLPALPMRYADYAFRQRALLSGPELDEHLGYWKRRLDAAPPLELPTDRPRPPVRDSAGAAHFFEVPEPVVRGLRAVARAGEATLFMVLAAATQILLARYSNQRDITVGTATSGRNRPEWEGLVGFFVNTIALRSQVDESLSFAEFLREVRGTVLDAFTHEVPFEALVDVLQPDRDPSRNSVVEVMVVLNNTPAREVALPGLRAVEAVFDSAEVSHDLSLDFTERDGKLAGALSYATGLFDPSTVAEMTGQLLALLEEVAARPAIPLRSLPALPGAERDRLLLGRNATDVGFGRFRSVLESFADQLRRTPAAPAVQDSAGSVTFAELDVAANRLARHLTGLGVRRGAAVAVVLGRGRDAVTALLAVLKAGAAFVPLEPGLPKSTLDTMLADAGVRVVVTTQPLLDRFSAPEATVVCLDRDRAELERRPADPPPITVSPRDLAYVVYTSGSTGRPKGVLIEHGHVGHIMQAWDARYGLAGLEPRCLSVSSLGVDLFFADFLLSALFGGTMVVAPADVIADPPALLDLIDGSAATLMVTVPTLATALAREAEARGRGLDGLRLLIVGSEGWRIDDAEAVLRQVGPETRVFNAYGATETTVDSTVFELLPGAVGHGPLVPVGRPLANTRVYVLDAELRPAPAGAAGELYIGGDGIARGYRNRPELTARRFVSDPFGGDPGARLYRTGDVVRWNRDGHLEFLGRTDDQVKIRGFRVELGAVELALAADPRVAAAAATTTTDTLGNTRLVGYVVPAGESEPDLELLRASLAERLPGYAVPSALVVLDELPMTAGGTVNRRALPPPQYGGAEEDYLAPRSETEAALVRTWAEVLGIEPDRIGVRDNFFALGGDSILSIQAVFLAGKAGVRISAKDLFLHQTVERLAAAAGTGVLAVAEQEALVGDVPLLPAQLDYLGGEPRFPHHFTQSVLVELRADAGPGHLRRALNAVVAQHDALRLRFVREDGRWRQYGTAAADVALTRHDLSGVGERDRPETMDRLAAAADASFDLEAGLLLRALLFEFGAGRRPVLLLTVHHLVVDGVSWQILLSDLDTAYRQAEAGEPVSLGDKTSSVRQWATALAEHVGNGGFDEDVKYWEWLPRPEPLPVRSGGENLLSSIRVASVTVGERETDVLVHRTPAVFRTKVNEVLLAALAVTLARWTRRDEVSVELEGHGRELLVDELDLSRTVGWFTSIFPVVLDVPAGDSPHWPTVIRSVRRQLRAVPGNGLSYGALRHFARSTSLAGRPRPQVAFNYHGQVDHARRTDEGGLYTAFLPPVGLAQPPSERAEHLLDVVGALAEGRLRFDWHYAADLLDEATVAELAATFQEVLRDIARHVEPDAT
ncbi:non-ribosomal peptide synthetase, partial [Amycolatopsis sp.]|uniref:non-ribosomal peptide synthetase n=1 Tax=Amycolatopsis sp. TaxID=37632 RepID=UPI002D801C47